MSEIVKPTDIRNILKNYKITIPIIQRDYVQGRKNQKSERVRKGLLKSIYNCLSDERDDTILDMNFIYGYCYGEEGQKKKFFPVDGQQRITAFYLLCWYLAVCTKDDNIAQEVNDFDFSYETRFSAGSFYQQFIKNCGELIDIVRNNTGSEMTKKIKALPSFHSEWQNDPTVTSSLIFLEDISGYENNVFGKNAALYFSRLGRIKFSPITNELSSKDEQSTEQHASDIYIRMNARGKPLEDFENIKAMFDRIEENIADGGSERLSFTYDNKYIHELFGYLKQPEKSLKDITNAINESSYIAFEQVFGLCGFEEDNMLDTVFWDSRKERKAIDDKKEKYQRFFYTVKALFDFFLTDKQKNYRAFFDNTFRKQGCCPKDILLIYYLYWFRKNHNNELPDENAADKLLEAADFILYSDPGKEVLDILARKVSGYDNIEKMFLEREWSELSDEESEHSIVVKGLEEFNVRLHELWLRTIVLNHESAQVTPGMIKAVTGQNRSAKLQFLFYISDMWYDTSGREGLRAEKLANLRKHFGTAVHFFPYGPKNDILHRKYYAAACYFDPDKKDFCSAEEINLCKRPHVWEKGYYEWDNDNNIPKEKLALIRRMYEHYDAIKDKIDSLTSLAADSPYRKCWLTYALMLDIKDILQNPVKVEKDQTVVKIIDGFKLIPKPVDAVILKNIDNNFQYGTKDFSASPCVMLQFSPGGKFPESEPKSEKFSISQTSHRNYNLWLYFKVDSNSINQKFVDTNSCVHSTDGKTDYIVRHCDSSDPFGSYKEYRFDITEYIEKTKKAQTQAANLCKALEKSQKLKWGIMFMSRKLVIYKSANAFSITENPDEISDNSIKVFTKNDKMIISDALKELEFPGKTQTRECIFEKIDYEGDPHSQQGELYELALKTVRPGAK